MKRIVIAVLLLVFLISICIIGAYAAMDITRETIASLDEVKSNIRQENFAYALDLSFSMKEKWESKHQVMCMYMSHDRLEKIDEAISSVIPLIEYEESAHILSECDRIIAQIKDLQESESLSIENIL